MTMLEATGSSGAKTPRSKAAPLPISTRNPAMMTRLRLRRFSSLSSGTYCTRCSVR